MGQMAWGIAGAVIGSIVPGVGTAIGYSIGSAIGGMVEPGPHTEGPRLADKLLTQSAYGNPVSRIYGTYAEAGEIIFALPIREVATQEGGGKGGGGPTTTTYSYFGTFAIALCEGPIIGVRRIWANGLLVYDVGGTGETVTPIVDGNATTLSDNDELGAAVASRDISQYMRVYKGAEDQMPDATLQANDPNTSAYRGLAYIVFEDLPLEKFYTRLPAFKFEVVADKGEARTVRASAVISIPPREEGLESFCTGVVDAREPDSVGIIRSTFFNADTYGLGFRLFEPASSGQGRPAAFEMFRHIGGGESAEFVPISSVQIRSQRAIFAFSAVSTSGGMTTFAVRPARFAQSDASFVDPVRSIFVLGPGSASGVVGFSRPVMAHDGVTTGDAIYALSGAFCTASGAVDAEPVRLLLSDGRSILIGRPVVDLFIESGFLYVASTAVSGDTLTLDVYNIAAATPTLDHTVFFTTAYIPMNWTARAMMYVSAGVVRLALIDTARNVRVYSCTPSTPAAKFVLATEVFAINVIDGWSVGAGWGAAPLWVFCNESLCMLQCYKGLENSPTESGILAFPMVSLAAGGTTVGQIVSSECLKSGLSEHQFDVSELTDEISGYRISGRSTGRQNIEPLIAYSFFDSVEIDHKIRFPIRNRVAVDVITEGEMGAAEEHSDVDTATPITRIQEMEIPQEVSVTYADGNSGCAVGAQYARRLVTRSNKQSDIQLPISMTAQRAAVTAARLLYQSWTGRNRTKFSVGPRWSHLMPSDAVNLEQGDSQTAFRITHRDESPAGVITFEAESMDVRVLNHDVGVIPSGYVPPKLTFAGTMSTRFLDIPLLRDGDNSLTPILYAGGVNTGSDFGSGTLFGSDDGTDYGVAATFTSSTKIGTVAEAVRDFAHGGYFFDDATRIIVRFFEPVTLASVTRLQALGLAVNACIIGGEIIVFQNATLTGGTSAAPVYTLSNLLRGQRGTEAAIGQHVAGEECVILSGGTLKGIRLSLDRIGVPRVYKSVTTGRSIQTAPECVYTGRFGGLRPLSPAHVFAGPTVGGGLIVEWTRRSRIDQAWRDFGEPALGEASEAYEIELLTAGGVLKRTITSASASAAFTAEQLALDFGGFPASYSVRVYQMSAVCGRSLPGTFTKT